MLYNLSDNSYRSDTPMVYFLYNKFKSKGITDDTKDIFID